jgi:hypothetical protein
MLGFAPGLLDPIGTAAFNHSCTLGISRLQTRSAGTGAAYAGRIQFRDVSGVNFKGQKLGWNAAPILCDSCD